MRNTKSSDSISPNFIRRKIAKQASRRVRWQQPTAKESLSPKVGAFAKMDPASGLMSSSIQFAITRDKWSGSPRSRVTCPSVAKPSCVCAKLRNNFAFLSRASLTTQFTCSLQKESSEAGMQARKESKGISQRKLLGSTSRGFTPRKTGCLGCLRRPSRQPYARAVLRKRDGAFERTEQNSGRMSYLIQYATRMASL